MKTEYCLSDKKHLKEGHDGNVFGIYYLEEDVKEFIKKLKEKISDDYRLLEVSDTDIMMKIDKLVGDLK